MEAGGQLDQVLQQRPGKVLKLAGIENNDFLANNQQGCTKLAEIGCGLWSAVVVVRQQYNVLRSNCLQNNNELCDCIVGGEGDDVQYAAAGRDLHRWPCAANSFGQILLLICRLFYYVSHQQGPSPTPSTNN